RASPLQQPPPARHSLLLAREVAKPWSLDLDLAAVEADLALRFPPAVGLPVRTPRMARTADRLRILIHHLGKGLHAGSQAKQLEARRNVRQGLQLQRSRRDGSRCSKFVHGVAFLCGISTPSLPAQGEQRRLSFFNIDRDNPGYAAACMYSKTRQRIELDPGIERSRSTVSTQNVLPDEFNMADDALYTSDPTTTDRPT